MPVSYTQELSCKMCGKTFVFRKYEQELFEQRGYADPKHCMLCHRTKRELREEEIERIENEKWQEKKSEDKKVFDVRLNGWRVVAKDDIYFSNDHVLYIIGNGFDLMHGVRSSYYAFRDTLRKSSSLLHALESFLTLEDIWADFEEALAYFNIN